jgi:cobalt-zinc-cadmium efflux system outer membrane protein
MYVRIVLAALGALHAVAVAQPLGIDEAAALAITNQPLITGQQATIASSRENAIAESQLPDPRLKLGINNVPVNGSDQYSLTRDFMTMRSIAVEQMFPAAEKRRLKGERATLETQLAEVELQNIRRTVRRDARLAWLGAYYPSRAAELMKGTLAFYAQQREALDVALRGGRASLADIARISVEIELQHDRLIEIAGQERKARAELARWIGTDASRALAATLPSAQPVPSLTVLHDRVHDHPQLGSARSEIALAENEVRQASAAYKSDWSVELAYAKRGPAYSDMVSVQVGIELPLFTANRQDRRLASRLAAKEKHEQQHENHRRMLMAEMDAAYSAWHTLDERVQRFEREVLPQANRRSEAAVAGYRSGRGDLSGAIEARRGELELRIQHLMLEVERARARVQLDYFAANEGG